MKNNKRSFFTKILITTTLAAAIFPGLSCVKITFGDKSRSDSPKKIVGARDVYAMDGMIPDSASKNARRTPIVIAVEKVSPSVVNINTEEIVRQQYNPFGGMGRGFYNDFAPFFDRYYSRDVKRQTLGTGVIIDPRGYILTNDHVIMSATQIKVTLPGDREYEARVIGADPKFDLAIIKIDSDKPFPAATTGDSDSLMIGETVIAIGNPFGLSHTVTTGVVSAVGRDIKTDDGKVFNDFIQTDASINPGNSGGPLVNLLGEIIGINTVIYNDAEGIGFAIPINKAMRAVTELIRFGEIKNTWSGLRTQPLTTKLAAHLDLKQQTGAIVADIADDSPASKAGLQPGDVIVSMNNKNIQSVETVSEILRGALAGERIPIKVFRDGKQKTLEMIMKAAPLERADDIGRARFGFKVKAVDAKTARLNGLRTARGVIITSVSKGTPAFDTGLQPGDIIHQIGSREILNIDDYKKAVIQASEQEMVFMAVQREGSLYYIKI